MVDFGGGGEKREHTYLREPRSIFVKTSAKLVHWYLGNRGVDKHLHMYDRPPVQDSLKGEKSGESGREKSLLAVRRKGNIPVQNIARDS